MVFGALLLVNQGLQGVYIIGKTKCAKSQNEMYIF